MVNFSNIKICFIAGTLGQGGAERQLYYILNVLKINEANVSVICLTKGEKYEEPIKALGITIYYAGQSASRLRRVFRIINIIRKIKPDIIQSQHFYTNIYAALSSRIAGIPGIGASRSDLRKEIELNGNILGKLCFSFPEYIAANSWESIEVGIAMGKKEERLFYLPNAVDTEKFIPAFSKPSENTINLINIGRQVELKRIKLFLELLAWLKKNSKIQIIGHIVGDGPLHEELKKYSLEIGLSDREAIFYGDVKDPGILLQKNDIFVLTSEYEGTPNVVLEAMACGLPVICTAVGNLPNIIKNSVNGFLINENNIWEDICTKALYLIENKNERIDMGHNARETVLREFSFDALGRQLKEIYSQIVTKN